MNFQENQSCYIDLNGVRQEVASIRELSVGEIFSLTDDDIAIIWLYNGTGALGIDVWGGIYMLGNDFLYVPGAHDMDLARISDGTRVFLLLIHRSALLEAAAHVIFSPATARAAAEIVRSLEPDALMFHWPHTARLISCMEVLFSDFNSPRDLDDLVILDMIRLLERLISIEEKDFAPVHSATHTNTVMYIVRYIRENYATASLNTLSRDLHYSPAYLSQILKENMGMNFFQLLDFRRSVVGRQLLLETRKSLEDIAAELGFQSYSGFYKFWKKQQGMSPKEYRERYSKENVKIDRKIRKVR